MSRCLLAVLLVAISIFACYGNKLGSEYDMAPAGRERPCHWHWPWDHDHHVAFSAYLSENKELKAGEKIVFDEPVLNDGDHYDKTTGVFKAPHDGVYMFTFVIGQRNKNEIRVTLKVGEDSIVGAVAEGRHRRHDVQGTNTAILHLHKGKEVHVEAVHKGHVEGDKKRYRFTTFSGHILYCLE